MFQKKKKDIYTAVKYFPLTMSLDTSLLCSVESQIQTLGYLPESYEMKTHTEQKEYKCKSCGASLDPSKNKCDYCGSYWR